MTQTAAIAPSARVLFHTEVAPPYSTPPCLQVGCRHSVACRPSASSEIARTALLSRIAFIVLSMLPEETQENETDEEEEEEETDEDEDEDEESEDE